MGLAQHPPRGRKVELWARMKHHGKRALQEPRDAKSRPRAQAGEMRVDVADPIQPTLRGKAEEAGHEDQTLERQAGRKGRGACHEREPTEYPCWVQQKAPSQVAPAAQASVTEPENLHPWTIAARPPRPWPEHRHH